MSRANARHLVIILTTVSVLAWPAGGAVLTFEDLAGYPLDQSIYGHYGHGTIPAGYGGLNWDIGEYVNMEADSIYDYYDDLADDFGICALEANYSPGFSFEISSPGATFDFVGAYLSREYHPTWMNLGSYPVHQIVVRGDHQGNQLYASDPITISNNVPELLTLNWTGIDRLVFSFAAGERGPFLMDNMEYELHTSDDPMPAVPAPSSLFLLAAGIAVLMRRITPATNA